MKRSLILLPLAAVLALAGCGGLNNLLNPRTSVITGFVNDLNNRPVRGAVITADNRSAITTASGAYQLINVKAGQVEVRANLDANGTRSEGRTFVTTFEGEQRNGGNIVVSPRTSHGAVTGTVRDRDGFVLKDVPVYAYSGLGSSQRAFTDSNGVYILAELAGGLTYEIRAMARGYRSDSDTVNITAGNTQTRNLTLGTAGSPGLTAPQNFGVTSWVSNIVPTAPGTADPLDIMQAKWGKGKNFKAPRTPGIPLGELLAPKAVRSDIIVQAQLEWNEQRFDDHLGWGIYRAESENGALNGLEFFGDPLSAFYFDSSLEPRRTYSYAATTLSSFYPDFQGVTESAFSSRYAVRTLDRLVSNSPTLGPLTFRWQNGSLAETFVVYLYDQYPGPNVTEIWNSGEANRVTGFSTVYSGASLQSGRTYYYIVLGLADGTDARTISSIGSFVP